MKNPILLVLISCLHLPLSAQNYFNAEFPQVWQRASTYTHAVAEQMPEDQYNFRPSEGAMSFGEQLLHIVDNISFLAGRISGDTKVFYDKNERKNLSKAQITDILDKANSHVKELITGISSQELQAVTTFRELEMTNENLFYLLRDHQVHHRGQCIVYLRMAGVEAPPYVGW